MPICSDTGFSRKIEARSSNRYRMRALLSKMGPTRIYSNPLRSRLLISPYRKDVGWLKMLKNSERKTQTQLLGQMKLPLQRNVCLCCPEPA